MFSFKLGKIKCSGHTIPEEIAELKQLLADKAMQPRMILTVNAHIYNLAHKDAELRNILNSARMVTADGMSIVWASRLFSKRIRERCNATEAFRAFLDRRDIPRNYGILVGCSEAEARSAAAAIEKSSSHCRIVRSYSGFLSIDEYRAILQSHKDADFIFLGMGTPRTEIISKLASTICPQAIIWGIGGGTVRIYAGTMKEAPVFLRRIGLQWFHRLYSEPAALWQRYIFGNPAFILHILRQYLEFKLAPLFGATGLESKAYSGAH